MAFTISPDEVETWKRQLEEKGVALESQVHCGDDSPLGDSLCFRDPDGHLIELIKPGCCEIYQERGGRDESRPYGVMGAT